MILLFELLESSRRDEGELTMTSPLGLYESREFSNLIRPSPLSDIDLALVGAPGRESTPLRKGLRLGEFPFCLLAFSGRSDLENRGSFSGGEGSWWGNRAVEGEVSVDDACSHGKIMSGLVKVGEGRPEAIV